MLRLTTGYKRLGMIVRLHAHDAAIPSSAQRVANRSAETHLPLRYLSLSTTTTASHFNGPTRSKATRRNGALDMRLCKVPRLTYRVSLQVSRFMPTTPRSLDTLAAISFTVEPGQGFGTSLPPDPASALLLSCSTSPSLPHLLGQRTATRMFRLISSCPYLAAELLHRARRLVVRVYA